MSCEVRLIAPVDELAKCQQFLFPSSQDNEYWLQECIIAVSPVGDRIVIAHGSALVILSTRWVRGDNNETIPRLSVSCQWDAAQNLIETEQITSVACLPLVAIGQTSHVGPDWTCIAIGFSTGYIRFFTEKMDLLAAELLHSEPLLHIKAASYRKGKQVGPETGEVVYAVYSSTICSLPGFSLFQTLRGCRGQVALRHAAGSQQIPDVSLDFKKYAMSSLSSTYQKVTDACFIGCGSVNNFDHLMAATFEGFYNNYRPTPPQQSLVATTGDWPWLKFQFTRDGAVAPLELTDVAVTVISKIPGWLGWSSNKAPEKKVRPAEKLDHRFSLTDRRRSGRSLAVSPDGSLFAVSDVLGRVALVDARTGVAIRMWKGYRDADCAFIEVDEELQKSRHRKHSSSSSSQQQQQRRALFLVIYSPKKSMLEVFALRHGPLVAALKVNKRGKLVYTPHGLLGFSTPQQKNSNASSIPAAFVSEDGLMDVIVPFHCALTDKNSTRAKDMHLIKQLRSWIKEEQYDNEKLIGEVTRVSSKLTTEEGCLHLIDALSSLKQITPPAIMAATNHFSFEASSSSSGSRNLQHHCEQLHLILDFFTFSTQIQTSKKSAENELAPLHEILKMSERDCEHFLEFLRHTQQISGTRKDAKVAFHSSNSSGLSGFLKNIDIGGTYPIKFKDSISDEGVKTVGEIIFSSVERNIDEIEEWKEQALKSRIEPMTLTRAFLLYKLQKLSAVVIEKSMRILVVILKALLTLPEVSVVSSGNRSEASWWKELREILSSSKNILIVLPIAVCCRAVNIALEKERLTAASPSVEATEEAILQDWENISSEVWEWDQLISQLEDTALLNAVLSIRHSGKLLAPSYGPFAYDVVSLSSSELVKGGDGTVAELVAKWLCQFEVQPELLICKSDIEFLPIHHDVRPSKSSKPKKGEEPLALPLIEISEDTEPPTDYNSKILGNLKILKGKFPYSLTTSALLSNVAWELFSSWHREIPNIEYVVAAIRYLQCIPSAHLRGAIASLTWSTHIKIPFEGVCRLVGKIGRLPTDQLCSRELNIPRTHVAVFLESTTSLLSIMLDAYGEHPQQSFPKEAICDSSSLVAVAVSQPPLNEDLVLLHHQASSAVHLVAALDLKHPKIFSTLFDSLKSELFGSLTQRRNVSVHHSGLSPARLQFLKKAVSASVQTIREIENESGGKQFETSVATARLKECFDLASAWRLPLDDLRMQHAFELYSCGFDRLAQEIINSVKNTDVASQLLVLVGQRVKALLADSHDYTKLVCNLNPALTAWIDSLDGEVIKETEWNKSDAEVLLSQILQMLPEDHRDYHLASLLAECLPGLAQDSSI